VKADRTRARPEALRGAALREDGIVGDRLVETDGPDRFHVPTLFVA